MSLYDDEELGAPPTATDVAAGWSKGINLMQSQMQLKKAVKKPPAPSMIPMTGGSSGSAYGSVNKGRPVLAPVIDLKSSKRNDDNNSSHLKQSVCTKFRFLFKKCKLILIFLFLE